MSVTVLVGRDGSAATRLLAGDGPATTILDRPEGWMADVLARCLGLPTPPPRLGLVDAVEAMWLHEIAVVALDRPPGVTASWEDLAVRHTLAPPGEALPPELLAHETESFAAISSWARLRALYARHLTPPDPGPPSSGPPRSTWRTGSTTAPSPGGSNARSSPPPSWSPTRSGWCRSPLRHQIGATLVGGRGVVRPVPASPGVGGGQRWAPAGSRNPTETAEVAVGARARRPRPTTGGTRRWPGSEVH